MDMSIIQWMHTWGSEYSPDDSKVLVAGVVGSLHGELAIFSTGRGSHDDETASSHGNYQLMCRVMNDPYDFFGCWASNRLFISGTIITLDGVASTIWLCETEDSVAGENSINLEAHKKALFKFRTENSSIYARFLRCYSRSNIDETEGLWPTEQQQPQVRADIDFGDNDDFVDLPADDEQRPDFLDRAKVVTEQQACVAFICAGRTSIPHQVCFQRLTQRSIEADPVILQRPEKVIDLNGQVVGIALSPEHSELYVNVRSWPDHSVPSMDNPPPISNQIELKVIDLKTLTLNNEASLHGHIGYTSSDKAFYLYLSVSPQLVASGSEDKKGYLWDRYYKCNVAKLPHEACVNAVVVRPGCNENTAVTASDDFTIRVWRSRSFMRMNQPAL